MVFHLAWELAHLQFYDLAQDQDIERIVRYVSHCILRDVALATGSN